MVLDAPGAPLRKTSLPVPVPAGHEVLLRVGACGV
jgi:D-arabinose 1-dehydrogenase-like Zn-dependent alcohol dehydrogenase